MSGIASGFEDPDKITPMAKSDLVTIAAPRHVGNRLRTYHGHEHGHSVRHACRHLSRDEQCPADQTVWSENICEPTGDKVRSGKTENFGMGTARHQDHQPLRSADLCGRYAQPPSRTENQSQTSGERTRRNASPSTTCSWWTPAAWTW